MPVAYLLTFTRQCVSIEMRTVTEVKCYMVAKQNWLADAEMLLFERSCEGGRQLLHINLI